MKRSLEPSGRHAFALRPGDARSRTPSRPQPRQPLSPAPRRPLPTAPRRPLAPAPRQPLPPAPRVPPGLVGATARAARAAQRAGARVSPLAAIGRTSMVIVAPALLVAVTALLIVAHQGRALQIAYPVLALVVGALLIRRYPAHYVGYLCWLSFLTPEVRRFADYFNGAFNPTSPIQVAPLAVAMLSGFTLLRHYRVLGERRGLPFLMIMLGVAYAYPIGVLRNSPLAATFSLALWIYPVLIGFHLLVTWRAYPLYARLICRTFLWGALVMGVYGIVQYFFMPSWDAFWLVGTHLDTEGLPVPQGIRVSSTMNSSAPFAATMIVALLLLLSGRSRLGWAAGGVGLCSLLLSVVRAAWGGLVVGLVYALFNLSNRMRVRVLASTLLLAALAVPILSSGPVSDVIVARFQTISDLKSDESFNERSQFYGSFLSVALSNVTGSGLGISGDATRLDNASSKAAQDYGSFDSGLMEIPFTLGWPGALLFGSGVGWLLVRAMSAARRRRHDRFSAACVSASLGLFSMLIFFNTLTAFSGMLFYLGVVLPIIGAQERAPVRTSIGGRDGSDA